jgi:beta-glucosidase-like glycosyl hydrolase
MKHILKTSFNFSGFVISDLWDTYFNHNDNYSLLDLNLQKECAKNTSKFQHNNDSFGSNHFSLEPLEEYVKNETDGEVKYKESAKRIIAAMYKMNQMEDFPEVDL